MLAGPGTLPRTGAADKLAGVYSAKLCVKLKTSVILPVVCERQRQTLSGAVFKPVEKIFYLCYDRINYCYKGGKAIVG